MVDLNIIIFSFNRALQLDALIQSILKNLSGCTYVIHIIYNASSDELMNGYKYLQKKYTDKDDIIFLEETNGGFKGYSITDYLTIKNLKTIFHSKSVRHPKTDFRQLNIDVVRNTDSRYVVFFTDDSVLYRPCVINRKIMSFIDAAPMQNSYSMRQGLNVDDCFFSGERKGDFLEWDYSRHPASSHWGYRFSVDGHIYSKKVIEYLISHIVFANPNTMEGPLCHYAMEKGLLRRGLSNGISSLLSFPLNEVNTEVANFAKGVTCEMLNEKLLNGYTLEYDIPESNEAERFQQFSSKIYFTKNGMRENYSVFDVIKHNIDVVNVDYAIDDALSDAYKKSIEGVEYVFMLPLGYKLKEGALKQINLKLNEFSGKKVFGIAFLLTDNKYLFHKDGEKIRYENFNPNHVYCFKRQDIIDVINGEYRWFYGFNKCYIETTKETD